MTILSTCGSKGSNFTMIHRLRPVSLRILTGLLMAQTRVIAFMSFYFGFLEGTQVTDASSLKDAAWDVDVPLGGQYKVFGTLRPRVRCKLCFAIIRSKTTR